MEGPASPPGHLDAGRARRPSLHRMIQDTVRARGYKSMSPPFDCRRAGFLMSESDTARASLRAAVVYPNFSSLLRKILRKTVNQRLVWIVLAALGLLVFSCPLPAQPYDPSFYQELHWRLIGPFRGGRTVAISGVPEHQNVFYMAPNNGGVWKTTDFGRTWNPIFDGQPTGSVGALAVAASNPDIIYVGSGEGLRRPDLSVGNGIYKSTDAGRTWQHLGRDGSGLRA